MSAPFRTEAGCHVVKRVGTRQADVSDQQPPRPDAQETIGRRKLEDEWNRYLREMRGEAFVDVPRRQGRRARHPGRGARQRRAE